MTPNYFRNYRHSLVSSKPHPAAKWRRPKPGLQPETDSSTSISDCYVLTHLSITTSYRTNSHLLSGSSSTLATSSFPKASCHFKQLRRRITSNSWAWLPYWFAFGSCTLFQTQVDIISHPGAHWVPRVAHWSFYLLLRQKNTVLLEDGNHIHIVKDIARYTTCCLCEYLSSQTSLSIFNSSPRHRHWYSTSVTLNWSGSRSEWAKWLIMSTTS